MNKYDEESEKNLPPETAHYYLNGSNTMIYERRDIILFVNLNTNHIETFLISFNKFQKALQENVMAFSTNKSLNFYV